MKLLIVMSLMISVQAFAAKNGLGEGAKDGCNPAEWTCNSACQMRKAAACGVSLSEDRVVSDKAAIPLTRGLSSGGKKGVKGQ